jgi:hypothetical protein
MGRQIQKKLAVVVVGMALVACDKPAGDATGATSSDLALAVRYTDDEVSKDSNRMDIRVSLKGSALTYELTRSGFGAEHTSDVNATVELRADEIARLEEWIAEGGLMQIESLNDTSQVEPGPHHRRSLSVFIERRGEKHEFSLDGIKSVKGDPTAFGEREDLREAELFVTHLTDLAREKSPRELEP